MRFFKIILSDFEANEETELGVIAHPIMSTFGRLRQENCEFESEMGCIARL